MAKTSYQRQKEKIAGLNEENRKLREQIYKIVLDKDPETIAKWKFKGTLERMLWFGFPEMTTPTFLGIFKLSDKVDSGVYKHFKSEKIF